MPIAPLMQRFVDDELARSASLIERTLAGTVQALVDAREPVERAQQHKLLDALRRQAGPYVGTFIESLRAQVQDALREQHDDALRDVGSPSGQLELMDESRVEIDIEISRATQTIDTAADWELRELQTFTSTLAGQTHVSADSNPLRPVMYATALWDAAGHVAIAHAQRAALLRVSTSVIAPLLKQTFAAAATRLEDQGVQVGIYRTVALVPSSGHRAESPGLETAPADLMSSLSQAASICRHHDGDAIRTPMAAPTPSREPNVEPALIELDALIRRLLPAEAASRDTLVHLCQRLGDQHLRLRDSASAGESREIIDMVSRLFETILSDSQLPVPMRAVLARIEVSALRVALGDVTMLQSYRHPTWQLIDRIGEAGAAYPQPSDPRLAALLPFCQALTDEVSRVQHPDATLYRRSLARLDAFLAQQLQWQLKQAQPTIAVLTRTEQRELLEQQVSQRLASEFASARATPGLRRFVVGPWAQVVAEAMLRFGQDGAPTVAYLKTVDDLLWSIKLPDHPQSRQRLVALLPGLLDRLRAGMATIALPEPEQQAVLDELMTIHTEALRPGARAQARSADANEIVRRLRDEVEPSVPGALPGGDAVIDLPSMETVPAELMPSAPLPIDNAARQVDAMRPGGRCRLFVHGRWSRTQLLWRSPQGRLFVFAGENPAQPHSITRRALERLAEAGLAELQSEPPLTRRSTDALLRNLTLPG